MLAIKKLLQQFKIVYLYASCINLQYSILLFADVAALVLDKCIKPDQKDAKVSVIDYEFLEEFAATNALE